MACCCLAKSLTVYHSIRKIAIKNIFSIGACMIGELLFKIFGCPVLGEIKFLKHVLLWEQQCSFVHLQPVPSSHYTYFQLFSCVMGLHILCTYCESLSANNWRRSRGSQGPVGLDASNYCVWVLCVCMYVWAIHQQTSWQNSQKVAC